MNLYFHSLIPFLSFLRLSTQEIQSQSHIATGDQSVSKSWYRAPSWGPWPDIYCSSTVTVLFLFGALSDERMGLSFIYTAGPCQRSVSWVLVPWDLQSHIWDFSFRRLLRLAGSRWKYSTPPPHGVLTNWRLKRFHQLQSSCSLGADPRENTVS
jgi:hypothetical protein